MRTYWHCEKCDFVYYVDHAVNAVTYQVVNRIRASHQKMKSRCQGEVERIRVIAIVDFQPLPEEAVQ